MYSGLLKFEGSLSRSLLLDLNFLRSLFEYLLSEDWLALLLLLARIIYELFFLSVNGFDFDVPLMTENVPWTIPSPSLSLLLPLELLNLNWFLALRPKSLFWPYHRTNDPPREPETAPNAVLDKMHGIWASGGPNGGAF